MKNTLLLTIFMLLLQIFTHNPSNFARADDNNNANINNSINHFLEESKDALIHGNRNAFIYLLKAEEMLKIANNDSLNAKFNQIKGNAMKIWGTTSDAAAYLFKALDYYKSKGSVLDNGLILKDIGETYRAAAELDKALEYLNYALLKFKNINDDFLLAKTYNRMAAVYYEKFINIPDRLALDDTNNRKTHDYYYKNSPHYKNIFDSLNKYLDLSHYNGEITPDVTNLNISTHILIGATYNSIHQLDKAMSIYNETLNSINLKDNILEKSLLYFNLSKVYFSLKDYKNAMKYAKESYNIAKENNFKTYIFMSAAFISGINETIGNFKDAVIFTKESILSEKEYINEKIESKIVLLNLENELKSKDAEAKSSERILTIVIAAIILITTIFTFLLYFIIRNNKIEKRLNAELNDKNAIITAQFEKVNELNSTKDKFFSIIAHDLKNPLGSFREMAKLLCDEYDIFTEDERKDFLNIIKDSSTKVYSLLENLLDWSRTQRGKLNINTIKADMHNIASIALEAAHFTAANKGITIENNIPIDTFVVADPNLINTTMRNIISNAVKFSNQGGIITIGCETARNTDNKAVFFIKDEGVGMNAETITKLFRIDSGIKSIGTNGETGTGLGLILCKEFIEKHNGEIWVESILGQGSTFHFSLPAAE